jgi:hypothetical protein
VHVDRAQLHPERRCRRLDRAIAAQRAATGQKLGRRAYGPGATPGLQEAAPTGEHTPRAAAARRREAQSWPLRPPAPWREPNSRSRRL